MSYNAMLQAARAITFSRGYRPAGNAQHVSVLRFIEEIFGRNFADGVLVFDRMRRKRHMVVYGKVGFVSKTEANNSVKWAREFVEKIKETLTRDGFL
ncbi:MAG: HEPN domain-containing protein [Methanosarcinales archaeon Met12]|nr:MAG: HEPN domain-containing protein [Methanosarcinales archaeon Met12]